MPALDAGRHHLVVDRKAGREGALREKIRFLCRCSLLVVDEIGYLPVTPGGGNLFFQLVNAAMKRAR